MTQQESSPDSNSQQPLDRLVRAINVAWISRYGGDAITDIAALENRINQIAADRDCWLANSKANQKEYLRLDAILRASA